MKPTPEVIRHWIDTIENEGKGLSSWEEKFIDDVSRQVTWSEKQATIIERIYAEKTA